MGSIANIAISYISNNETERDRLEALLRRMSQTDYDEATKEGTIERMRCTYSVVSYFGSSHVKYWIDEIRRTIETGTANISIVLDELDWGCFLSIIDGTEQFFNDFNLQQTEEE